LTILAVLNHYMILVGTSFPIYLMSRTLDDYFFSISVLFFVSSDKILLS
jgi:hypothetical protein